MPLPLGAAAPDFSLEDQFGRRFRLAEHRGHQVLMLFYPLDWTPTCSSEVPELDALADRFRREADTVVVALSVDSKHSHAHWCADVGGVAMPVLADFQPHGAVAQAYGLWRPDLGVADRGTILVDRAGRVAYAASVGVDGRRDLPGLLAMARDVATRPPAPAGAAKGGGHPTRVAGPGAAAPHWSAQATPARPAVPQARYAGPIAHALAPAWNKATAVPALGPGLYPAGQAALPAVVYLSRTCFFCRLVARQIVNLHCGPADGVVVRDVVDDPGARAALDAASGGRGVVPTMVTGDGRVVLGASAITAELVRRCAPPAA